MDEIIERNLLSLNYYGKKEILLSIEQILPKLPEQVVIRRKMGYSGMRQPDNRERRYEDAEKNCTVERSVGIGT